MKDILLVLPEIVLLSLAALILIADLFVNRNQKWFTYACGIAALLWTALYVWVPSVASAPVGSLARETAFSGLFVADGVSTVLKLAMLLSAAIALAYSWTYLKKHNLDNGEFVALVLFGTLGMMVIASAASMLTAYLGLELLSLSMYALVALKRDDKIATEAAMKYFVLGALASGLLLFGMSIVYGATGTISLGGISAALGKANTTAVALGLIFIAAGVAFKLGVVPFHMWVPDVYTGAPTAVTLILATAPKIAAFALAYRLFGTALTPAYEDWSIILAVIATLSIVLGNLIAVAQTNIKRMLAYSAIANMGFLLLGFVGGGKEGYSAALFYAVAYAITGLVSFGILVLLSGRRRDRKHQRPEGLERALALVCISDAARHVLACRHSADRRLLGQIVGHRIYRWRGLHVDRRDRCARLTGRCVLLFARCSSDVFFGAGRGRDQSAQP